MASSRTLLTQKRAHLLLCPVGFQANLHALQLEILARFDSDLEEHEVLIADVWAVLLPGKPFVRVSPTWQAIGFQQDNPITDLRGSGLLALRCLMYLGDHYPEEVCACMHVTV